MSTENKRQQGSALIVCMILAVVVGALLTGMVSLNLATSQVSAAANDRVVRLYAAEAGLERIKQLVVENTTSSYDWLDNHDDGNPITFSEGGDSFSLGDCAVKIRITKLSGGWYLTQATATDSLNRSSTIAMTVQPRSYFSDYARFVSDNNLSIGSNASYDGKVHSNGYINCAGSNITFYDDVTAHGSIYTNSTTTFMKNATPGVDRIELPEASELEALVTNPPAGATVYDWDNSDFRDAFKAATGQYPNSTLEVSITFDRNKMTVTSKCNVGGSWKTMTETSKDVPDQEAIYVRGPTTIEGNISRRTSVITPKAINVVNSVRYVDDSGDPLWQLRNKSDGSLAGFSSSTNTWTPTDNWKDSSNYSYTMDPTWDSHSPKDASGKTIIPCLGLVSGSTIYLKGGNNNREVHAALFTSGDVVRPSTGTSKRKNLHIHGSIITTGTNPLSGSFSYRTYAYDPNLKTNPPPAFPTTLNPSFTNWHKVGESE